MMFGLASLLAPVTLDEFLDRHHEQSARHIPGTPDKFARLFGWEELSNVINDRMSVHSKIKLVMERKTLPVEALDRIDHWLREGATLVVDQIDTLDPVLRRFTEVLTRDLNLPAWINAYVSWPDKQGFDIHFDTHDVFVVHIAGSKRWAVYQPTRVLPLDQQRGQPRGDPPALEESYLECVLSPGDVLYIPRGHWHYALSQSPSIHLTVGLSSRSAIDFLQWLSVKLRDADTFWRRNFPVTGAAQFGGEHPASVLDDHLAEFRRRMHDVIDDDSLMDRLLEFCMLSNPLAREYQLPDEAMLAQTLTPDARFMHPTAQKYLVSYDAESKRVITLARGHVVDLQNIPRAVAQRVFQSHAPFSGNDLSACNPSFTWEQAKPFLLRLYQAGLLRRAEE